MASTRARHASPHSSHFGLRSNDTVTIMERFPGPFRAIHSPRLEPRGSADREPAVTSLPSPNYAPGRMPKRFLARAAGANESCTAPFNSLSIDEATASPPPPDVGLFRDIPRWIWAIFLSAWAIFFGLMILFFATAPQAAFVVTISALFGLMAFGLPMALAAQSQCGKNECTDMIDTHTGPLGASASGIQIALIRSR